MMKTHMGISIDENLLARVDERLKEVNRDRQKRKLRKLTRSDLVAMLIRGELLRAKQGDMFNGLAPHPKPRHARKRKR